MMKATETPEVYRNKAIPRLRIRHTLELQLLLPISQKILKQNYTKTIQLKFQTIRVKPNPQQNHKRSTPAKASVRAKNPKTSSSKIHSTQTQTRANSIGPHVAPKLIPYTDTRASDRIAFPVHTTAPQRLDFLRCMQPGTSSILSICSGEAPPRRGFSPPVR